MLRPATPPGPMAKNSRQRQRSYRSQALSAAAWVGAGALGVAFLACLFTLISIQCQLEMLQGELSQLRGELRAQMSGTTGNGQETPKPHQRTGNLLVPHAAREKPPTTLERMKRELGKASPEPPRHRRKHSILHLVPDHQSNSAEGDSTEIWWKPFLQQGRALEPSGRDVVVKHTGLYFVYSQVLFNDPTFTMGQMLQRIAPGRPDQILFRCIQSMPPDPQKAYNSCYSGGVFHLQHGDRLNLRIPRFNASLDVSADGTFLGLLRL